jgi:hypothetical protein
MKRLATSGPHAGDVLDDAARVGDDFRGSDSSSVELLIQDEENTNGVPRSRRTFRAEVVGFNSQPDAPGKWAVTLRWSIASQDGPGCCSVAQTGRRQRRLSRRDQTESARTPRAEFKVLMFRIA